MQINKSTEQVTTICDFKYLSETMGGKKKAIREVIDAFVEEVPQQLQSISDAILKMDYLIIKRFAHVMRSSVSIMGISALVPVLQEMENLGTKATDIEKIKELNQKLNLICKQALEEIEKIKPNYV